MCRADGGQGMSVVHQPFRRTDGSRGAVEDGVLARLHSRACSVPDGEAIVGYDDSGNPVEAWTWSQLARAVGAASMRLGAMLRPDEAVILRAPNSAELVVWFLACLHAGVRVCTLHVHATDHELREVARVAGAKLVIGPRPVAGLGHLSLGAPVDSGGQLRTEARARPGGSVILQSSGTTGRGKLVRRSMFSLDADAAGLSAATGLGPEDKLLIAVPLSHSYGVDLQVGAVYAGAALHVFDGFAPGGVERVIRAGRVSVFPGVPFMFEALGRGSGEPVAAPIRLALSAGSALPVAVQTRFEQAWGLPITQLYGASELGTVIVGRPAEERPSSDAVLMSGCVGLPLPGVSVRVLSPDDPGREVVIGDEGELAIRAPSMLDEYLGEPLELTEGHFRTGDLGRVDHVGRVFVTGRIKHLIDVGGLKVNPLEVEAVFAGHADIRECAVVPMALSETVAKLRLLFVPRNGCIPDAESLRAFGRERLAPHKMPRVFERVQELPRSATGKLLRHLIGAA